MKGRIIGALWIIAALLLCYFCFDGVLMNFLIGFCLLMGLAEIVAVTDYQNWRMKPDACPPRKAWVLESCVLILAIIACFYLTPQEFAVVILTSALSDLGAFTIGKLFGKHHIDSIRKISPNKTFEGYIGGAFAQWLTLLFCPIFGFTVATPQLLIYVFVSGFVAEMGDLLGSATKRQLGMKDSAEALETFSPGFRILEWPIRGHGGYLDRIDSLSLCIVVFAIIKVLASLA